MDLTHIHLLPNHFPTIGYVIAGGLFLLALTLEEAKARFEACRPRVTLVRLLRLPLDSLFRLHPRMACYAAFG
jgi:hypothetical protein